MDSREARGFQVAFPLTEWQTVPEFQPSRGMELPGNDVVGGFRDTTSSQVKYPPTTVVPRRYIDGDVVQSNLYHIQGWAC